MDFNQEDIDLLHSAELKIQTDWKSAASELLEIKTKGLYRIYSDTIEGWCELRLGWKRQRLYQVIGAFKAVADIPADLADHIEDTKSGEELKRMPVADRVAVLQSLVQKGKRISTQALKKEMANVTANGVGDVTAPNVHRDLTGHPIPEARITYFYRGDRVREYLQKIADVRGMMRRVQDCTNDNLFGPVNVQEVMANLTSAYDQIKCAIPYAVCPYCQGQKSDTCLSCKGRGFLSEFAWKTVVPQELKLGRTA